MLQTRSLKCASDRHELTKSFSPETDLWVVSDLQSKFELQDLLLERVQVLNGEAVLRASEFWQRLLEFQKPNTKIVSRDYLIAYAQAFVDRNQFNFSKQKGVAKTLVEYVEQLLPLLSHVEGPEILSSWLKDNPSSFRRWGEWALASLKLWSAMDEDGVVSSSLASGLLDLSNGRIVDKRMIYFDLGVELKSSEMELIREMSKYQDLTLLYPEPEYYTREDRELVLYSDHMALSSSKGDFNAMGRGQVKRFSSMLSEVKDCTSQVRAWIDSGIDMKEISIVAPDIGVYWPALIEYLREEGISFDRAETTTLASLPEMGRLTSLIRLNLTEVRSDDLEVALFSGDGIDVEFEEFQKLYTNIYDDQDIKRSKDVYDFVSLDIKDELLSSREFVGLLLRAWVAMGAKQTVVAFEKAIKGFVESISDEKKFKLEAWFECFQSFLSHKEIQITEPVYSGVRVRDLSSTDNFPTKYVYFLGCSDQALSDFKASPLTNEDALSLSQASGFELLGPESRVGEFHLKWLLQEKNLNFILSFAEFDFLGTPLTPSYVWLKIALQSGKEISSLDTPGNTFWDDICNSDISEFTRLNRDYDAKEVSEIDSLIQADLGLKKKGEIRLDQKPRLSASSVESYYKCPFTFFASRVLKLVDVAFLDMDLDPRSRGQLSHRLLKKISENLDRPLSKDNVAEFVEEARREERIDFFDPELWEVQKTRYIQLGLSFIGFERKWSEKYPESKISFTELPFEVYWDQNKSQFESQPTESSYLFRGEIDRIDTIGEKSVVIDYKTSTASKKNHPAWIKSGELQLAIYSKVVSAGLTPAPSDVVGGVYYDLRNLQRDMGFLDVEMDGKAFEVAKRKHHKIDSDGIDSLFDQLSSELESIVESIESNRFDPEPKNEDDCKKCHWRSMCRAPHLN